MFSDLKQPPLIEALPSVTYGINQLRATPIGGMPLRGDGDIGVSGKYGITSNVTLDATRQPRFQPGRERRLSSRGEPAFPGLLLGEAALLHGRPGAASTLAGTGGDGNMRTAVHTRRIIDPFWGSKLTGTLGKATFGLLTASDEHAQLIGVPDDPLEPQNKFFSVGRLSYSLGQSNYVGAIFTDTEHVGRHNRVLGGDLSLRLSPPIRCRRPFCPPTPASVAQRPGHGIPGDVPLQHPQDFLVEPGSSTTTKNSRWTPRFSTGPASLPGGRTAN